mgnify:CR=1 FL=1
MLARADHLASHIDAIWLHLPESLRGQRLVDVHARAPKHWAHDDIVMVASFLDIGCTGKRRTIYVEHGAGQQYNGNGAAADYYHGGEHPDHVNGYIGPRPAVIESWQRPGFATGAPVCDPYELFATDKVAAITFPYVPLGARLCPEMGSAFEHYVERMADVVRALRDHGYEVLGHRHPRFNHLRNYWQRHHGIPEATVHEVRARAQLLIADNTSLMYEMLYLGRDVIALNAPWFRRNVEHGLRFWSHAPSVQADNPDELIELVGSINTIQNRSSDLCDLNICDYVYGKSLSDGHDGLRAASWVTAFVHSL